MMAPSGFPFRNNSKGITEQEKAGGTVKLRPVTDAGCVLNRSKDLSQWNLWIYLCCSQVICWQIWSDLKQELFVAGGNSPRAQQTLLNSKYL